MGEFYERKITIDENLYLVQEDSELYNHLKLDMYAALSDCVHTADMERLTALLEAVKREEKNQRTAIRMLCQDDTYRWFMVTAETEQFDLQYNNVLTLAISDWLLMSEGTEGLRKKASYNDTYLQMLGGILLCYDRDKDHLDVFIQKEGRHVNLFAGTISKWKQYCQDGRVAKCDLPAFMEFCEDLEAGRRGTHDILTSMFSEQKQESLFTFKCSKIHGQSHVVLGCIIPHSQGAVDLLGDTYEKDVGVDALNKKAITKYAKKVIHAAGTKKVYIGIIDLDNFKSINDTFGHLFGDEVLRVATDIINKALGQKGILGRIGGDEFMIVVDQISDYTEVRNLLRTIRTNIEWAYKGKRDDVITTCSIGISCYPEQGLTFEEVFETSDRMLYIAKEKGKNRYVIYTPGLHDNQKRLDDMYVKNQDVDADQYRNNKLGILQRLTDDYLIRKIITNDGILREIGLGFDLQEILFVASVDNESVLQWTLDGITNDVHVVRAFEISDELYDCFDQNGMYVMNHFSLIENKSPQTAEALKERGVQSAIFYRIADTKGYIMFAKTNFRQQWSEYEIMAFGVIGKVLEVAISSR